SAIPLLLVFSWSLGLISVGPWRRRPVVIIDSLAISTGFGLFAGLVTIALFALELRNAIRARDRRVATLFALLASIAALSSFFAGYRFQSSADCFVFPDPRWLASPSFVSFMFAAFCGFRTGDNGALAAIAGLVLFAIAVVVFARNAIRVWRSATI